MSALKLRIGLIATMICAACSSTPPVTELPATANPQQEISKIEDGIKQAQDRQADVLAPQSFEDSKDYLSKAKEARDNNKDQKYVLHQIAIAQAYLDKANNVVSISTPALQDVMAKRQAAINANAPRLLSEEFNKADDDLKDIGNELEAGDLSSVEKAKGKLQARYADLELNSIKKAKLSAAREDIQSALREDAKNLTPQTLSWTQKKVNDDENTIVNNLHNTPVVDNASTDASAAAHRLLMMVRQAKTEKQKTPEQLARETEQTQLAEAEAEQKLDQESAKAAALAAEKNNIQGSLNLTQEKLSSETRTESQYSAARQEFTPDEAIVYKQGNKVVLRLKGLSFPTAKAIITPENYSLLAKVQKIMKESGDDVTVTVEGHTDSTGSPVLNSKLSQSRANAVQSYLVANNTISQDRIKAVGYGDAKPIASNKTSDGRAQNRRVDVIISTEPVAGAQAQGPQDNQD